MAERSLFTIGGTIKPTDNVIYIERQADIDLLKLCEASEFAHVLAARQRGKSSLVVHTSEILKQKNIVPVYIDLTILGRGATVEQWYLGIIRRIQQSTGLQFETRKWWRDNEYISTPQRLVAFFETILLKEIDQQIVIFLDEIDTTLSLDFTDDFYAAIRAIYNERSTNDDFKRLSFVLIGTASPTELISDPSRTPFNIGKAIALTDFTLAEGERFVEGFPYDSDFAKHILGWIFYWTNGHPYLTQRLCDAVVESPEQIRSKQDIDELVTSIFFSQDTSEDHNLQYIRTRLTQYGTHTHRGEVVGLLKSISEGYYIADDHTSNIQNQLKLSGIVRVLNGRLLIRNRIYEEFFDLSWIAEIIQELELDLPEFGSQKVITPTLGNSLDLPDSYIYAIGTADDYQRAQRVWDFLAQNDIDVWHTSQHDSVDIEQIQAAIYFSQNIIYLASPTSLTSTDCQTELNFAQASKKPLVPLWIAGDTPTSAIPLRLINEQVIDLRSGRESNLATVLQAIQAVIVPPVVGELRNPYKGLRSFEAQDAPDFFGRSHVIETLKIDIRDRIANYEPRFLAVIGASGSGKSSLVRAGLIPALQRGELPGSGLWTYIEPFVPSDSPFSSLATALEATLDSDQQTILDALNASDRAGLVRLFSDGQDRPTILFIDQFEEVFTLTQTEEERESFINLIVQSVTDPSSQIIVIIAMRADFFEHPTHYPRLGQLISDYGRTVLEMSRSELIEAIEQPAYQDDVRLVLDDGLVDSILYDLRDQYNQLPLLQFTLDQLFDRRDGNHLTLNAYHEIGSVTGALSLHAQNVYDSLPSDMHRNFARSMFMRLVVAGETIEDATRRRTYLGEFDQADIDDDTIMAEVIDAFVDARLLVTDQVSERATLEVGHEALIREWALFGKWITDSRDDIRFQEGLTGDTAEWIRTDKQEDDRLYRGNLLDQALAWRTRNQPSIDENEFIKASIALRDELIRIEEERLAERARIAKRADQFQRVAVVAGVFVILAIAATAWSLVQVNNANTEIVRIETEIADNFRQATVAKSEADTVLTDAAEAESIMNVVATRLGNQETQQAIITEAVITLTQQANDVVSLQDVGESIRLANLARNVASSNSDLTLPLAFAVQANNFRSPDISARQVLADQAYYDNVDAVYDFHSGDVTTIALHPNNTTIATSGCLPTSEATCRLGEIVIWDWATDATTEIARLEAHVGDPRQIVFSHDGTKFASAECAQRDDYCTQGEVIIWDTNDWEIMTSISHGVFADVVEFSPVDSNMIAFGGCIQLFEDSSACEVGGDVVVLDTSTNQTVATLEYDNTWIGSLTFDQTGSNLFVGMCITRNDDEECTEHEIVEWNWQDNDVVRVYEDHTGWVNYIKVLPDDNRFISASGDETLILWDRTTGEIIYEFDSHSAAVQSFDVTNDGKYLISASDDETLILWDIEQGTSLVTFEGHGEDVRDVIFLPDSLYILSVSEDDRIIRWSMNFGAHVARFYGHDNGVSDIAVSPDGKTVVSTSFDDTLYLWDIASQEPLFQMTGHSDSGDEIAFSPDGRFIASSSCAQRDDEFDECVTGELFIWDAATGYNIRRLENGISWLGDIIYSPDGNYLVTAGCSEFEEVDDDVNCVNGHLIIRDGVTGDFIAERMVHESWINGLAFSPDSEILLTGSCTKERDECTGGEILVWDVDTWTSSSSIRGHSSFVASLAFHPAGNLFVSGSGDDNLILWNLERHEPVGNVWDAHTSDIRDVQFSPDGRTVISASDDNTLILWDVATGRRLATYEGHSSDINSVDFTPDGRYVISGAEDDTLALWLVNDTPAELVNWTLENRTIRSLTCAERRQYNIEPQCENVAQVAPTVVYPTLTPTATPDFDIVTATATPSTTPIVATYTPTSTIAPNEFVVKALDMAGLSQSTGYVAETIPEVRIVNMADDQDNWNRWTWFDPDFKTTYTDFVVGTTFRWGDGAIGDGCGFNMRYSDNSNYVRLRVLQSGNIVLGVEFKNDLQNIHDANGEFILTEQDAINELVVVGIDDSFSIYLNGQYVEQYIDDTFTEGVMTLAAFNASADDNTSCTFEDSWVWDITDDTIEPPPPPPPPSYAISEIADVGYSLNQGKYVAYDANQTINLSDNSVEGGFESFLLGSAVSNFVIGTTVENISESPDECGFSFNYQDSDNRQRVVIDNSRFSSFNTLLDDEWQGSRSITGSFVDPDADNQITLVGLNNTYTFYINGALAGQYPSTVFEDGRVGLYAIRRSEDDDLARCTFSKTWVWEITDVDAVVASSPTPRPSPTPTPPPTLVPAPDYVKAVEDVVGFDVSQGRVLVEPNTYTVDISDRDLDSDNHDINNLDLNNIILKTTVELNTDDDSDQCEIWYRDTTLNVGFALEMYRNGYANYYNMTVGEWDLTHEIDLQSDQSRFDLMIVSIDGVHSFYVNNEYIAQMSSERVDIGNIRFRSVDDFSDGETMICDFSDTWVWELTNDSLEILPTPPPPLYARDVFEFTNIPFVGYFNEYRKELTIGLRRSNQVLSGGEFDNLYDNFMVGTTIAWGADTCGIKVRGRGNENFYFIHLNQDQEILFSRRINDEWLPRADVVSSLINSDDNALNTLNLLVLDENFKVFINGEYITEFTDTNLTTGELSNAISLGADNDSGSCTFYDTWVWEVPEDSVPPTQVPTPTAQPSPTVDRTATLDAEIDSAIDEAINDIGSQVNCLAGITAVDADIAINVRSGPGTTNSAMGSLQPDTPVTILERNADSSWLRVDGGSIVGWVSASLICNS